MRLVRCLLVAGCVAAAGCGTKPTKGTTNQAIKAAEDPWPAAVASLRKETTAGSVARVFGELTAATSGDPKFSPESLPPAAEAGLKETGRLTDDDLKAIRPAGFSALDPHYAAECFYLRDAARALDLDGLPPAAQAERAFAWVCRQVVLSPWTAPGRSPGERLFLPPVPPSYVLRRGSGSGLERAYVMLALCQQLGLDAVLVGPPDAADKGWIDDPAPQQGKPPRGPFWAVGVRAGGDVLLFDPWRGVPVAGPSGKGVLTLTQAVATAEAAKDTGVSADRVKASVPFVSVPLPALAPRFKRVESELKADAGARLFVDLAAVVKGFADATKTAPKVWNPPGNAFAYPRVLADFVPPAEGGTSPLPALWSDFRTAQLPPGVVYFGFVPGLLADPNDPADFGAPDFLQLLQVESLNRVGNQFLTDPTPRERIQRGQADAVRGLVVVRDDYQKGQERLRTDRERDTLSREWVAQARTLSRRAAAARDRNPADRAQADGAIQKFWQDTRRVWLALVDQAVAETGVAESTYLIALAKHDQAVREQGRADRQPSEPARKRAADAWAEARGWWERFEPYADVSDRSFPGRAAHARRLAAEAAGRAGG